MNASASRWCTMLVLGALAPLAACELGTPLTDPSLFAAGPSATFTGTGGLTAGRSGHTATSLGDGRVLIAGGINGTRLASTELFDPVSGRWAGASSMAFARHGHAAVALEDGRVLVVGGVSMATCANQPVSRSAELFDATSGPSGTWSGAGNMSTGRVSPAAVRLADGRVLVAGGGDRCGGVFPSAEIYDPVTGTWVMTARMNVARQAAAAMRLSDGRVLVVGGVSDGSGSRPFGSLASAEIYDPATGTWTLTGNMNVARLWGSVDVSASHMLGLLPGGRVLAAGGFDSCFQGCGFVLHRSAEELDPATGTWTLVGSMSAARSNHRLSRLPTGHVLVVGGLAGSTVLGDAEVFDPASRSFVSPEALLTARYDHSATPLADGRVLIAGGQGPSGALASAEIFQVNRAPVPDAGGEIAGLEGSAVAFDATRSTDPDGQTLTFAWDFGDGAVDSSGPRPVHVYADDGTYQVRVTVSDGALSATAGTVARVANVAPSVGALPDATLEAGQTYQAAGGFSDPGADSWSATVDYGDGAGPQALPMAGQTFMLSHPFATAGTYTVRVVVSDDDGGEGAAQAQVVVTEPPVLPPSDQIDALITLVGECAARGELSTRWASQLTDALRAAQRELEGGRDDKATRLLRFFVHIVRALKSNGLASAGCAEELVRRAEAIISVIDPSGDGHDDDDDRDDIAIPDLGLSR